MQSGKNLSMSFLCVFFFVSVKISTNGWGEKLYAFVCLNAPFSLSRVETVIVLNVQ